MRAAESRQGRCRRTANADIAIGIIQSSDTKAQQHLYTHFRGIGSIEPGNGLHNIIRINTHAPKNFTNGITQFRAVCFRGVQVEASSGG
ncbi:Uncharacterised protein [Klebsiella pneumoniae]|nr:Uncharacterised protein [Klebsiella pneumoniae]